jgi:CMP-N-acetylneuraminic acid synthetase
MNDRDMSGLFELVVTGGIGDDILFGYCDPHLPYYYNENGEKYFNGKYFYFTDEGFIKHTPIYHLHYKTD